MIPGGRKPYHGQTEVMPSTWLDVVEPQSIEGRVSLFHWRDDQEEDEEEQQGGNEDRKERAIFETNEDGQVETFYWRQVVYSEKGTVSPVKKHCKCNRPSSFEELMIKCDTCDKWSHAKCIEEDVVARKTKGTPSKKGSYSVKVERKSDGKCTVVITSHDKKGAAKTTEEDVDCLLCGASIV